jgi:hypothetical protein
MHKVVGALVVAVAIGVALVVLRPAPASTPATTSAVNPPDPAVVDPAPYQAAFPLTPLDAPRATGNAAADQRLEQALVPYRAGDYQAAATALDAIHLDHPDDHRTTLYLAVTRLLTDEPQNALEILRSIPIDAPAEVAGNAAWYTLVGIARLRDPSHAEAEARTLCDAGAPTSQRACAALDALRKAKQSR